MCLARSTPHTGSSGAQGLWSEYTAKPQASRSQRDTGTPLEPFQIKHSVLLQLLEDIGRPAEGNSSCFSPARGESMLFRLPVAS